MLVIDSIRLHSQKCLVIGTTEHRYSFSLSVNTLSFLEDSPFVLGFSLLICYRLAVHTSVSSLIWPAFPLSPRWIVHLPR